MSTENNEDGTVKPETVHNTTHNETVHNHAPATAHADNKRKGLLDPISEQEAFRQATANNVSPGLTRVLIKHRNGIAATIAILGTGAIMFLLGVVSGAHEASNLNQDMGRGSSWSEPTDHKMSGQWLDAYKEGYSDGFQQGFNGPVMNNYGPYDMSAVPAEPNVEGDVVPGDFSDPLPGSAPADAGNSGN